MYDTSDKTMIMALLMSGFRPKEVKEDKDNQLVYYFVEDEVTVTVDKLRMGYGEQMVFTFANYWAAEAAWQMNLRHNSRRRRQ